MNQERLMWRGQRSDAEGRLRDITTEMNGIVRTMRMELNPMLDVAQLDTDAVLRSAERLAELRTGLVATRDEIAKLDNLLAG